MYCIGSLSQKRELLVCHQLPYFELVLSEAEATQVVLEITRHKVSKR